MRYGLCLLLSAISLLAPPGAGFASEHPALFGSRETMSTNMKPFVKWIEAAERAIAEKSTAPGYCAEAKLNKCNWEEWQKFLAKEKGKDKLTQIKDINDYANRARYITDPVNWGLPDFWASPYQFLVKEGDCEDYAIIKYFSLKQLGFPAESLRIVAVKDNNLNAGHAVLAVYHEGKALILDNQIKQVVDSNAIRHYEPVFSINETAWWRHSPQ